MEIERVEDTGIGPGWVGGGERLTEAESGTGRQREQQHTSKHNNKT